MTGLFKILIVDDDADYRETYRMLLVKKGYIIAVASSAEEAYKLMDREFYPLIISDIMMPGVSGVEFLKEVKDKYSKSIEVIMVTGYGSVETAVQTMKLGAFGYFIKSHNPEELILEIEKVHKIFSLQNVNEINKNSKKSRYLYTSKNKQMQRVYEMVEQVAESNSNVLITGESGVGKEIIANMIHDKSGRSNKPFIPINCGYFSTGLIESELFGHEKGAFTGATTRRIGHLEEANEGTVFLDEIGDMEEGTQVKLLRVLETRQIERIGSNKLIDVDFRLVSATNKDLVKAVADGKFREDLFFRINTIEINIPPLRQRKEDIEDLIYFLLNRYNKEMGKGITDIDENTKQQLLNYNYPGNIRELKNIIERLVVLSRGNTLKDELFKSSRLLNNDTEEKETNNKLSSYKEAKKNFEIEYIKEVLKSCNNNITHAAKQMDISRRQLFNKIVEYDLKEYSNDTN
ncbi:sigma-54-dependent Fis family transcriptional regulator [Sedimentibacter hydroxybenzoicus DSM 7310]|uniref:Sigma-54-dependent Fis family transcriptional regulator n=1 Tax=Sedimentibacter hydroxybenzoicus DSM 7310 TaxID=1123245 RepID=A0A974BKY0_SEDHY|nr:sigma-54 dependent transcriptional regulator [Sedimentibacter hydroxybenzoicus]NYB74555.1 sigma-54-dependent Fis family transcriptional regulator [Sedimentibacter hydroxybenzoicus DSM 7310]